MQDGFLFNMLGVKTMIFIVSPPKYYKLVINPFPSQINQAIISMVDLFNLNSLII